MVNVFKRGLERLYRGDQLWILGDLTMGTNLHETLALDLIRNFKESRGKHAPQIHLIWGNHDSGSPTQRDGWKRHRKFLEVFDSVQSTARLRINGTNVLLNHFPYTNLGDGPNREGSRYPEYRIPNHGTPLVHGHTHQTTPHAVPRDISGSPQYLRVAVGQDTSQYCVSWDVARKFVPETDLMDWLERRKDDQIIVNDIRSAIDESFDDLCKFWKES